MTEWAGCSLLCLFWQKIESLNVSTRLSAYQNRIGSNDFLKTNGCKRGRHSTSYGVTFERLSPLSGAFKISSWQLESIINMQHFKKPTISVGVGNKMLSVKFEKGFCSFYLPRFSPKKGVIYPTGEKSWGKVTRAHNNTTSEKVVPSHIKITEEHCSREAPGINYTTALKTNCATEATKIQSSVKTYSSFQKRSVLSALCCIWIRRPETETLVSDKWETGRNALLSTNKDGFQWKHNKINRDRGKPADLYCVRQEVLTNA